MLLVVVVLPVSVVNFALNLTVIFIAQPVLLFAPSPSHLPPSIPSSLPDLVSDNSSEDDQFEHLEIIFGPVEEVN